MIPLNLNMTEQSTILSNGKQISDTCWNWCTEQNINHASTLEVHGLTIALLSLISLFAWSMIGIFEDRIMKELNINYETFNFYRGLLVNLAQYLLIGFFIWYLIQR